MALQPWENELLSAVFGPPAAWVDRAFVDDRYIDHEDERVHRVAFALHADERDRRTHDPDQPLVCVACARRATTVVRFLSR